MSSLQEEAKNWFLLINILMNNYMEIRKFIFSGEYYSKLVVILTSKIILAVYWVTLGVIKSEIN